MLHFTNLSFPVPVLTGVSGPVTEDTSDRGDVGLCVVGISISSVIAEVLAVSDESTLRDKLSSVSNSLRDDDDVSTAPMENGVECRPGMPTALRLLLPRLLPVRRCLILGRMGEEPCEGESDSWQRLLVSAICVSGIDLERKIG